MLLLSIFDCLIIFLYILDVFLSFNLFSICLQNLCTTFLMTNSCLTCYKIFLTISYIIQVYMNSFHLLTKICWWFGGPNCSCRYISGKDRFWYFRCCWKILMLNPHKNPPPLFCWPIPICVLRIPTKQKRYLNILLSARVLRTFSFLKDKFNFQIISNPSESSWF